MFGFTYGILETRTVISVTLSAVIYCAETSQSLKSSITSECVAESSVNVQAASGAVAPASQYSVYPATKPVALDLVSVSTSTGKSVVPWTLDFVV